ncbi:hypothetical protein JGU66_25335 [Myxococcaceae bacterium JPH2]|nr:hypothetical protein [Myxococcaceae bacterium JPH2]
MSQIDKHSGSTIRALAAAALAMFLGGASRADAATAQKLCFRTATGVPGVPGPPTIDGDIASDLGWTGAFRYEFGNGTSSSHGVIQGNRDGSNVYLSFEVNNDATFDDEDVLVLTFDVGGATNRYRRLHLFPLFAGTGAAADARLREVQLWQSGTLDGSGKVVWGTGTTIPHASLVAGTFWLDAKVKSTDGGAGHRTWNVEMKIPIAASAAAPGINFPPGVDFKMFLDAFRVDSLIAITPSLQWPGNAPVPTNFVDLENATPAPADWGAGTFGTSGCGGVSFDWSDITTNNTPSGLIKLNAPNSFRVNLHNNSESDTGVSLSANDIKATFKIANFGLPAPLSWQPVPAANNPTPSGSIPPISSAMLSTGDWTLTPAQQADYSAHAHQCILAEVESGDARTLFINRSAWRNMDFGTASTFERTAEIATKGYKLPREAKAHRIELLAASEFAPLHQSEGTRQPRGTEATWLFHGYRHLGAGITIKKKSFEVVEPVGSFGYVIRHELSPNDTTENPSSKWQLDVKGIPLNPRTRELPPTMRYYQADIEDGKTLAITARAEYPEPNGESRDGGTSGGTDGGTGGHGGTIGDSCGCKRTGSASTVGLMGMLVLGFMASRRSRRE